MTVLAIDLDGTLLDSNHQISQTNLAAVRKASQQGATIVLATGRSIYSTLQMIDTLAVDAYVIALNGTVIGEYLAGKFTVYHRASLDRKVMQTALAICEEERITYIASNESGSDRVEFDSTEVLVQEFLDNRPDLRRVSLTRMHELLSAEDAAYLKLAFTDLETDRLLHLQQRLAEQEIETIFSDYHYIEHLPANHNKGAALQYLIEKLNRSITDTIAIGDQENDLEMLTISGLGIAMGNAKEKVKQAADYVTGTNDEHGVAQAIEYLLAEGRL